MIAEQFIIETEQTDFRWIAEIPNSPARPYGETEEEVREKVCVIALSAVAT